MKLDKHRLGDGTDLVLLQLVGQEEGPQIGGGSSTRRKNADRRTAFAASLRKEAAADEVTEAAAEAPAEEAAEDATATAVAEAPEETTPEAPEAEGGEDKAAE